MIKLILTDEQAKIVAKSCEFYTRVKIGQFDEITWNLLTLNRDKIGDDFCERRDNANKHLLEARKFIYPELYGFGHSYGIGKFKDADLAFDVYQVIRPFFGDNREPFSYYELPKCEKCND